jgi:DNA-directed RNA polymerase subunit RPC12/RpoP
MQCPFPGCTFSNKRTSVFHAHLQSEHGVTDLEQAYCDIFHSGQKQTCKCASNCGSPLRWKNWYQGYPKDRIAGHQDDTKIYTKKELAVDTPEKCPYCSAILKNRKAILTHCRYAHNENDAQRIYDDLLLGGIRPICVCSDETCQEVPEFHGIVKGYSRYRPGHHSKDNNNFHANGEETYQKISETRIAKIATGEIGDPWNKGDSKENNPILAIAAEKASKTMLENVERMEDYSQRMSENRLNGTIRTLYGPEHSQWNGGYSYLSEIAHSRLVAPWKNPKKEAAEYKCQHCGTKGHLHVHHDGERFAEILREASKELNYQGEDDFEIKGRVADRIVQIHLERNVSGIVLCVSCHDAEHQRLGENFNIFRVGT